MNPKLQDLIGVTPRDNDEFTTIVADRGTRRLFGGQIAAQALTAAYATVGADRPVHSIHANFILAGRADVEIVYAVARVRDGGSFSTRHVTASQNGRPIFVLTASFNAGESGADWQAPTADLGALPAPNEDLTQARMQHFAEYVELRPVDPAATGWNIHPYWFRVRPDVDDDHAVASAMLTFVSDIALMANAREPGTPTGPMRMAASLDHAVWFHRVPRVGDWLRYSVEPLAHIGARGLVRGSIHAADGSLVASVAQEALLRPS